MFQNAQQKLGVLIRIITILNMIVAAIAGLALNMVFWDAGIGIGILLITVVVECVLWVGSLLMIGFCDMMSDVNAIRKHLDAGEAKAAYDKLVELRNEGLITEEDFNKKVKGGKL